MLRYRKILKRLIAFLFLFSYHYFIETDLSHDENYALVQLARTQAGREDTMVGVERDALLREVSDVSASLLRQEFMADLKRRGDVVIR